PRTRTGSTGAIRRSSSARQSSEKRSSPPAARRSAIRPRKVSVRCARAAGGEDLFSELCRAEDEDGVHWSDQEIVDHFNFLMMAAHDTTTSALTTMAWALAEHPDWQEAIREELAGLPDGPLPYEALEEMVVTERVFREALRLMPPVPFIPRVAFEGFSWAGHDIPAGAPVVVAPGLVMRDPALWSDPDRFDPDRFTSNRAEDRNHRFAWAPFGGGAHKCIGLNFAYMQVKAFTRALLSRHRLELAEGGAGTDWAIVPIPKPKNGLPLRLRPV
ncbi:MAG: cytochrome P450, partial [Pseudomonadota bacterium]